MNIIEIPDCLEDCPKKSCCHDVIFLAGDDIDTQRIFEEAGVLYGNAVVLNGIYCPLLEKGLCLKKWDFGRPPHCGLVQPGDKDCLDSRKRDGIG